MCCQRLSGVTNLLTQLAEDAAEGKSFSDGLKSLEDKHFTVVKELLAVKYQNPVFTKLKLFFNEIEDLLQGISALKELSNQVKI